MRHSNRSLTWAVRATFKCVALHGQHKQAIALDQEMLCERNAVCGMAPPAYEQHGHSTLAAVGVGGTQCCSAVCCLKQGQAQTHAGTIGCCTTVTLGHSGCLPLLLHTFTRPLYQLYRVYDRLAASGRLPEVPSERPMLVSLAVSVSLTAEPVLSCQRLLLTCISCEAAASLYLTCLLCCRPSGLRCTRHTQAERHSRLSHMAYEPTTKSPSGYPVVDTTQSHLASLRLTVIEQRQSWRKLLKGSKKKD